MEKQSFYNFSINTPAGKRVEMSQFANSVVLVVNTATKCGLAPQFDGLEKLHQKYRDKGLVVLGFPSDQFLGQEPETNETIVEACRINHGVTFQLFEKINVNGKDTHPIFTYLKSELPGFLGGKIKWNFTKFLIDRNGKPVKRFAPTTLPEKLEADILKYL
jgi:glutathione peroxidase